MSSSEITGEMTRQRRETRAPIGAYASDGGVDRVEGSGNRKLKENVDPFPGHALDLHAAAVQRRAASA